MMRETRLALAKYLRTSLEDYGKSHQLVDQSNSIINQRKVIERYIVEHEDLNGMDTVEYIDDGYTGTNMDRPRFRDMIRDIEDGKISCIIVKDLSRLGRNYLEVGEYLEKIFPAAGIRVITATDGYDSQTLSGTTGGIAVGLRNLIYDSYSKDLSVKVRSAMQVRMEKGRFVNHTPYGYQKSPEDKHLMIPDPETAPIVREIFRLALAGKSTSQIATVLNDRKVPTPLQYKQHRIRPACQNRELLWSHVTVLNILHNYKYTGAMINHMRENRYLRDKNQRRTSPEEWIITENAHEALVTKGEFEQVSTLLRHPQKCERKREGGMDAVFYCGHCGRKLHKTYGKDTYFSCDTPSYQTDAACKGLRWSKAGLETILLPIYQAQLVLLGEKALELQEGDIRAETGAFIRRMAQIEREISSFDHKKMELFEAYHDGELDLAAYLGQKAVLVDRVDRLRAEYAEVEADHRRKAEEREKRKRDMEQVSHYLSVGKHPDQTVVVESMYEAIDHVLVTDQQHIEVQWKFANLFENIASKEEVA